MTDFRRVERIIQLCGSNSFLFFTNISQDAAFSTEGYWYPGNQHQLSIQDLEKQWVEKIKALIPNRTQRRALDNPKHRRAVLREFPQLSDLKKDTLRHLPLPDSFIENKIFYKYMSGEITAVEANRELNKIYTDLNLFIKAWFDYAKGENPLTGVATNGMEKMKSCIENFRMYYPKMVKLRSDTKKRLDEIRKTPKHEALYAEMRAFMNEIDNNIDFKRLFSGKGRSVWNVADGFLLEVFQAYMEGNIKQLNSRKAQTSDAVDMLHAVYLPYCDLWRGDSSFAHLLIRSDVRYRERIVPRLRDLPQRISECLAARG